MDGAEGNRRKIDLLRKFMNQTDYPNKNEAPEDDGEELELSLGLSMNGRFGVDPTLSNKKLKRSSSIANLRVEIGTSRDARDSEIGCHAPALGRTQSLPVETEEERRRRKEVQSMRRMEARKKRMEKLKNLRVLKTGLHEGKFNNGQRVGHSDVIESSQGSIGPLRSGSSGSSDLIEGTKPKPNAEVSPSSCQNSGELRPASQAACNDSQAACNDTKGAGTLLKKGMFDMPYVTTKEVGPNGRKIEGFLCRYKKGEEVRIVCVCHGMFLTPKEFVEHGGGGGNVEHPLKQIVVNPFPLL